jgi:magnesium transporter
VGWYGMNFESMPEFKWRFGYLYVILLSIAVVLSFVLVGKRKKWF